MTKRLLCAMCATARLNTPNMKKKNAAFIVRACNAHPDMLCLLKRINEAFYVKGTRKALLEAMKETKPLIAKAEGRGTP
jgi:hypothetical protein